MFLCLVTIIGCQKVSNSKDTISNSDIYGTWVNTSNSQDTIQIYDSVINRWYSAANCYGHQYKFYIKSDSIILTYDGVDKMCIDPYHKKMYLNGSKDSLTIQDFQSVYPCYQGDIFKKIKK
jgi:hypothetical protein